MWGCPRSSGSCEMPSAACDRGGWSRLDVRWRPWISFLPPPPFLYQHQPLLKLLLRLLTTFPRPSLSLCVAHLHPPSTSRGGNEARRFLGHWDRHLPGRHHDPVYTGPSKNRATASTLAQRSSNSEFSNV